MKRIWFPLLSAWATLTCACQGHSASAAELKVLGSLAFTDAWRQLKPQFEARGHRLDLVLEPSGKIAKRVSDGEAGDLILNTTSSIEALSRDGKVVAGTSKYVASSAVGI